MQRNDTGRRLAPKYGTLVVPEGGLFTTSMVAKICGCDPQLVRKWARTYRRGQKMSRDIFLTDEDVALFLCRRKPGRPRKEEYVVATEDR